MNKKIVTMGEIMLRLSPEGSNRIIQTDVFEAHYGGAEANVSVLLGNLGVETSYITKVPKNDMGENVIRYLKKNNVDTSYIAKGGERLGIYFFERGASVRPSKVIYDRANSSISKADFEDFNFEEVFRGAEILHISGITPVLSENCLKLTKKAIEVAKKNKVKISIDLNYRSKLCDYSRFVEIMKDLIQDAYICFGWIDPKHSEKFNPISYKGEIQYDYFSEVFNYMNKELKVKNIVTTLRNNISSTENSLVGIGFDGDKIITSKEYTFEVFDRIGAGDAFAAGVLYKLITGKKLNGALEFGVASAVLKHSILGDSTIITGEEEITSLMNNENCVVQR